MSEETTNEETTATEEVNKESAQTTETDFKAEARKWEERSKENYTNLQAAEAKAAEFEKKIADLTKSNEDLTGKAGEVETLTHNALRYRVAALHGIKSEEDIDLFLTGSDEETLTKQAQRISLTLVSSPKPDPAQGKRISAGAPNTADLFAQALEGQL